MVVLSMRAGGGTYKGRTLVAVDVLARYFDGDVDALHLLLERVVDGGVVVHIDTGMVLTDFKRIAAVVACDDGIEDYLVVSTEDIAALKRYNDDSVSR